MIKFEIWAGFGLAGKFGFNEFIVLFINILSKI